MAHISNYGIVIILILMVCLCLFIYNGLNALG
jgi:hypothetical protein